MKITLKAARVNAGYTQRQVAQKLKVSKDTVSNWERGKSFPDVVILQEIENLYGVSYKDIIFCHKITI